MVALNGGFWGAVLKPLIVATVIAGGSGLMVSIRQCGVVEGQASAIVDHEHRIRAIESKINSVDAGVQVLLERTSRLVNLHDARERAREEKELAK